MKSFIGIDPPRFGVGTARTAQRALLNTETAEGWMRSDLRHLHLTAAERAGINGAAGRPRLERGKALFNFIKPRGRLRHAFPQRPLLKRSENRVDG